MCYDYESYTAIYWGREKMFPVDVFIFNTITWRTLVVITFVTSKVRNTIIYHLSSLQSILIHYYMEHTYIISLLLLFHFIDITVVPSDHSISFLTYTLGIARHWYIHISSIMAQYTWCAICLTFDNPANTRPQEIPWTMSKDYPASTPTKSDLDPDH